MADIIFYTNPQSRGQIVHWMLEELAEPYDTRVIEYGEQMKGPEYLAVNPMGQGSGNPAQGSSRNGGRRNLYLPGGQLSGKRADSCRRRAVPGGLLSLDLFCSRASRAGSDRQVHGLGSEAGTGTHIGIWQFR